MNKPTRLIIGLCLAGVAALVVVVRRTDAPPELASGQRTKPAVNPSPARHPPATNFALPPLPAEDRVQLPPPEIPAAPAVAANMPFAGFKGRPPEESMLISWAARDPEGAGRWLNQNRNHPKFADMVRGYAIQIATIDPAAARQWAAVLNGTGNRFALGGTLEQHINAIEAMLKRPDPAPIGQPQEGPAPLIPADYTPVLVRQNPDEVPVLEMQPTKPLV